MSSVKRLFVEKRPGFDVEAVSYTHLEEGGGCAKRGSVD